MLLYHGSENIIFKPVFGKGNSKNDYGKGFYCTESFDIAGEWACKRGVSGYINSYELDIQGLNVCNLNDPEYNILNWLAVLTKNRGYWQKNSIAEEAKEYLQEHYLIDLSPFDIVIGYRADDSYFSFAQDFIMGTLSLRKLSEAMFLGKLGEQVVLKSEKAFEYIKYLNNIAADADVYFSKKVSRDIEAKRAYTDSKLSSDTADDIFMIDILRGRLKEDDLRI